jgi:hypothetical protein
MNWRVEESGVLAFSPLNQFRLVDGEPVLVWKAVMWITFVITIGVIRDVGSQRVVDSQM